MGLHGRHRAGGTRPPLLDGRSPPSETTERTRSLRLSLALLSASSDSTSALSAQALPAPCRTSWLPSDSRGIAQQEYRNATKASFATGLTAKLSKRRFAPM